MRKKKATPPYAQHEARRKFLRTVTMGVCLVGAAIMGVVPMIRKWVKRLRPPGALEGNDFYAACIKCGQCVQVCPVEAIKLADLSDGAGIGTPYIDPRAQACDFSCDGLQCVLACPTGALSHELNYPHEVRMAVAKLARPEGCLAAQGKGVSGSARGDAFEGVLRYADVDRWNAIPVRDHPYELELCDLCVRQCPIELRIAQCDVGSPPSGNELQCPPEHAIRMRALQSDDGVVRMQPEILEGCVGCGVCEMVCPAEPAAIVIEGVDQRRAHA